MRAARTGANIVLLQPWVRQIIAMDYSKAAVARCQKRLADNGMNNVEVFQGDITSIPIPDVALLIAFFV